MKRLILVLLLAALMLTGCSSNEPEVLFDEATEGIISVILQDTNDGTIHYDTIGPDGQRQETQPFESDQLEILTAASNCYKTYHNEEQRTFSNKLVRTVIYDENEQRAEITDTIQRIFKLVEQQVEHGIFSMRILRQGEHHFVTTSLNVNFWLPHEIYYYDPAVDQLVKLYTYDATKVIGLKILNLPCS